MIYINTFTDNKNYCSVQFNLQIGIFTTVSAKLLLLKLTRYRNKAHFTLYLLTSFNTIPYKAKYTFHSLLKSHASPILFLEQYKIFHESLVRTTPTFFQYKVFCRIKLQIKNIQKFRCVSKKTYIKTIQLFPG